MAEVVSKGVADGDQRERLASWQGVLLRSILLATGAGLVAGTVLTIAFRGGATYYLYVTGLVGLLFLALSPCATAVPRLLSHLYVVVFFATLVTAAHAVAWAPALVVGACCLVVLAGLLLGRRAVFLLLASIALLLVAGGFAVNSGIYAPPGAPTLDPTRFVNWVRVAIMLTVLTGAASWALTFALKVLEAAEVEAEVSLDALRDELGLMEEARTRRLERETDLRDAQKLQMAAQLGEGFAHLLNNVLTVVRVALDEARRSPRPGPMRDMAARIVAATEATAEKTRDLLLLTRPHGATNEALVVEAELSTIGRALVGRLRDNVKCELDFQPVGEVRMPLSWLEQMTLNLLLNAEQAMPEGGRVRLATRLVRISEPQPGSADPLSAGTYAAISVSNTGVPIESHVALRACEPFFTTKRRDAHDGLGLTITYGMARDLGGSVDIVGERGGTTATIYLPVAGPSDREDGTDRESLPPLRATEPPVAEQRTPTSAAVVPPAWKITALEQMLKVATVAACTGLGFTLLLLDRALALFILTFGGPLIALLALATWRRQWPFWLRLGILLGAGLVFSSALLLRFSFLNPSPVSLLAMVVLVTAVYAPRAVPVVIGTACGMVLLGGWLHGSGVLVAPLDAVTPERATNWFRFAGIVVPLVFVVAFAALNVFESSRARIAEMTRAHAELERGRRRREQETRALARVEQMAGRASRMEAAGHLTGRVVHDLNNCLQAVLGSAEALRRNEFEDDAESSLEMIQQATSYAEALVQKLLPGASETSHGVTTDVGRALAGMRHMLDEVVRDADHPAVQLRLLADSDCCAAIDELSLRRVVLNLVINARDAMPAGGTCTITLTRQDASIVLSIADTGSGIDTATRERLFEPFFTTKGNQGTGLGLHSVREIVETTGGDIEVRSEPRRGSCFTIRWPEPSTPPGPPRWAPSGGISPSGARVLLAEDDPLVRGTLAAGLRGAGYAVTVAHDGDSAIELVASSESYDLLCTDAIMPGRSLPEVIAAFADRFPGRPVILMSGYLPELVRTDVLGNALVSFIPKPFGMKELVGEIECRLVPYP